MPTGPDDQVPETGVMVIELPVVEDLDFLPYYPDHRAFVDHSDMCPKCHMGGFHRDQFPPDTPEEDLFCLTGANLMGLVRLAIIRQHQASLQN